MRLTRVLRIVTIGQMPSEHCDHKNGHASKITRMVVEGERLKKTVGF